MVVLFDFDEVFVDLNTGALKYINEKIGTNYTIEDITSWDFFDKPNIRAPFLEYLALPNVYQEHVIPNKKMINILKQMVEMNKDVYIVTATVESSQESKYKFIKEHMSFFDTKRLYTVNNSSKYKNKSDVLNELKLNYHEPIVLVDDGIHNILDIMADIKHKKKLDNMMKQFYHTRTLKKFNNPYHDFTYGIVPELPYNKDIIDGKRIFKLKEPKDIWKILKKIEAQHTLRVETKHAEVFNYLTNVVNELLPVEYLKKSNEIQNNVSYFAKSVLVPHNKHAHYLAEIARFNVMVEILQEAYWVNNLNQQNYTVINKKIINAVFDSADKKFDSDVMYQEIKNLVILHSASELFPEYAKLGQVISENYSLSNKNSSSVNLIKTIINISKDNMLAGKEIVNCLDNKDNRELLVKLFHKSGVAYEIDFEDKVSLVANAILAFNKNYIYNSALNILEIKDQEIEEIRKSFLPKSCVNLDNNKKIKSKV